MQYNEFRGFQRDDIVRVAWKGEARYGWVQGAAYRDGLPTGAWFVPVFFEDDGSVRPVDTRVVWLIDPQELPARFHDAV